jgi:hypothetical protein
MLRPDLAYPLNVHAGSDCAQMTALAGGMPANMGDDGAVHRRYRVQYIGGTEESSSASLLGAQPAATAAMVALTRRARGREGAYIAREIFFETSDPHRGDFTYVAYPARIDGSGYGQVTRAPRHGENTDEVLTSIGTSADEVATLRAAGQIL